MADMHDTNAWTSSPSRLRRRAFAAFAVSLTMAAAGVTVLPGSHPVRAATPDERPSADAGPAHRPLARTSPAPATSIARSATTTTANHDSNRSSDGKHTSGGGSAARATTTTDQSTTLDRLVHLGEPIYCGAGTEPLVALTFDDGPGILAPLALKELARHDAPATFFLVGKLIGEPQFDGIVRDEARIGVIGDHTWDHIIMTKGSPREYQQEIARTRSAARRASGQSVRLFRPPFGAHDASLDRWVRSHGMLEVIWSIDTGDSQGASADKIYRTVKADLSPGDIILLHDNRGTTENALPRILDLLETRGLTPVTVPELLTQDPPSTKQVRHHTCP
jgi:peptidoglycan/xylan/chitin deacetylase (PgdA/CDA1 family)